ncbi:MAG: hypothetical protein E7301_11070 [Butyrivibrio sp.]|nr:hypothetical protein [Butyrivibrio sp.]
MDAHIRAYGGTGSLIARCFVLSLMVNPLVTPIDVYIYRMDLDDGKSAEGTNTDYDYLEKCVNAYNNLNQMGCRAFCSSSLSLDKRKDGTVSRSLKQVRELAYTLDSETAENFDYSIKDTFIGGEPDGSRALLLSALELSQLTKQNKDGAYGDLSRNAFLAHPIRRGFKQELKSLDLNDAGSTVIYCGSTDGGTANTLLDPELFELGEIMNQPTAGHNAQVYSVRTLPYKTHPTENATALEIAKSMVAQSSGVMKNILNSNTAPYNTYYKRAAMGGNDPYILDGLVLVGYNVPNAAAFDNTNEDQNKSHLDHQFHYSHAVEFASALSIVDILNGQVAAPAGQDSVFGYQVSNNGNPVELDDFIKRIGVEGHWNDADGNVFITTIAKRMRTFAHLYAVVKLHMINDFDYSQYSDTKSAKKYVTAMNGYTRFPILTKPLDEDIMDSIYEKLKDFIENAGYFMDMMYDIQNETSYDGNASIGFFPKGLNDLVEEREDGKQKDLEYSFTGLAIDAHRNYDWIKITNTFGERLYYKKFWNIYKDAPTDPAAMTARLLEEVYEYLYKAIN